MANANADADGGSGICVLVGDPDLDVDGIVGIRSVRRTSETPTRVVRLRTDRLKLELERLTEQVGQVLSGIGPIGGDFRLDEVALKVDISAEGEMSVVGLAHAKAGLSGGVELRFKRRAP